MPIQDRVMQVSVRALQSFILLLLKIKYAVASFVSGDGDELWSVSIYKGK